MYIRRKRYYRYTSRRIFASSGIETIQLIGSRIFIRIRSINAQYYTWHGLFDSVCTNLSIVFTHACVTYVTQDTSNLVTRCNDANAAEIRITFLFIKSLSIEFFFSKNRRNCRIIFIYFNTDNKDCSKGIDLNV